MASSLRSVISLFVAFLFQIGAPSAATIVVLKGDDSPFYRKILSGFSSSATEKITAFRLEPGRDPALLAQVRKLAPDLIVSIGPAPLKRIADTLPSTPIIACQPLGDNLMIANVLRIENDQPIRTSLVLLQALFPARKTVGTVYNPKFSQPLFGRLVAEGGKLGLRIAALRVDTPSDAKTLINALAGKIDAFFWIRDATTADDGLASAVYDFAEKNSVPVVTPEADHMNRGALLAVTFDPFKLGEEAWEKAKVILKEKRIPQVEPQTAVNPANVAISLKAASRFGIGSDALYMFLQRTLKENFSIQIVP